MRLEGTNVGTANIDEHTLHMSEDKAKAKKKSITMYLTDDEYFELQDKATRCKMRPNELARELVVKGRIIPTNIELHERELVSRKEPDRIGTDLKDIKPIVMGDER